MHIVILHLVEMVGNIIDIMRSLELLTVALCLESILYINSSTILASNVINFV